MTSTSTVVQRKEVTSATEVMRDIALSRGTFYPVGVLMGCAIVLVNRDGVIEIRAPGYDHMQVSIDHPWIQGTVFEQKIREFLNEATGT